MIARGAGKGCLRASSAEAAFFVFFGLGVTMIILNNFVLMCEGKLHGKSRQRTLKFGLSRGPFLLSKSARNKNCPENSEA
jgi:hypothetical protein